MPIPTWKYNVLVVSFHILSSHCAPNLASAVKLDVAVPAPICAGKSRTPASNRSSV